MMFDWLSIVFIAIFVLFMLIGFIRGGAKEFWRLIFQALAIGLAFALCKAVGKMIYNMGLGNAIGDPVRSLFLSKVEYGGQEVDVALLDEATRQSVYGSLGIPSFIQKAFDAMVVEFIPETGTVVVAEPFVKAIATAACTGIGFLSIYIIVAIIGGIVQLIINKIQKANGNKPGIVGRILGLVVGFVHSAAIIWVVALVFNILFTFDIPFIADLQTAIGWNDPSKWTFAKWIMTMPLGYQQILQFFVH